ncbi:MAG: SMC-Scp complex subunit ScpB [Acidimicrobiia bacterium]|nr:SMC-Scp complex subunit ScpB [Acidimicrobiia bacterium]
MNNRSLLEAILFVAEEPVAAPELAQVLELPVSEIVEELGAWARDLERRSAGFVLREVAGGWRLYSNPDAAAYLERFAASPTASRLSQAALETLAVVAYRQPVSRGQVSEIRGVDCERTMRTLERYGLIAEVGIAPGPGSPILYGSTELFLEKLGLKRLSDLPPLAEHVPPAEVVEALERPFRPEASSSESTS